MGRAIGIVCSGYLADSECRVHEYPGRIARRKSEGRYYLACGRDRSMTCQFHRGKRCLNKTGRQRKRSSVIVSRDSIDSSWIQRIFSNTPFSVAAQKTAADDVSWMLDQSNDNDRQNANWHRHNDIQSANVCLPDSLSPIKIEIDQVSSDEKRGQRHPDFDFSLSSEAYDTSDEELSAQEMALMTTVSNLLKECQEIQARYRSYSLG